MPVTTLVLLAIGAALRLWQFLGRASFRESELAVIENLRVGSVATLLTSPLSGHQSAPKMFLVAEKLMMFGFGPEEWPLRLFPFLAGLASLPLFAVVAGRLGLTVGGQVALALFALGMPFVGFGAQVKPYTFDVVAAMVLLLLALRCREGLEWRRSLPVIGAGLAAVSLSHAAVFLLASLGAVLGVWAFLGHDRGNGRVARVVAGGWLGTALGGAGWALVSQTPQTHHYLQAFWARGFAPPLGDLPAVAHWVWGSFLDIVGRMLGYPWPAAYLVLMGLGAILLWRRRRDAAMLLLAPVGAALLAAAAHLYPFQDRLILFAVPLLLLLVGEATDHAWHRLGAVRRGLRVGMIVAILLGPLVALWQRPPVYRPDDIRRVVSYVQSAWRRGDVAYVYYGALPGVRFYAKQLGGPQLNIVGGRCHRGQPTAYLEELDGLRGRTRVWLLATHVYPFWEWHTILRYLDAIGIRRDSVKVTPRGVSPGGWANAYLYDLSNPRRLKSARAETFPIPDSAGQPPPVRCG